MSCHGLLIRSSMCNEYYEVLFYFYIFRLQSSQYLMIQSKNSVNEISKQQVSILSTGFQYSGA